MRTSPPSTSSSRPSKTSGYRRRPSVRSALGSLALAGLVVALDGGVAVAVPSLDEAVRRLEAAYRGVRDLAATFEQTNFNRTLNQSVQARGTLYLKRPGRLRWEYSAPTPQEIVSDGRELWVYTPELKQVNVAPAPQALAGPAGSFLHGLGQVREHFRIRFLNPAQPADAEGLLVLDLTPKTPQPLLARLILSVDPETGLVRKAVLYDELGNAVTLRFQEVRVNSGLADALFVFTPPPGVAVLRAPAPGR